MDNAPNKPGKQGQVKEHSEFKPGLPHYAGLFFRGVLFELHFSV